MSNVSTDLCLLAEQIKVTLRALWVSLSRLPKQEAQTFKALS